MPPIPNTLIFCYYLFLKEESNLSSKYSHILMWVSYYLEPLEPVVCCDMVPKWSSPYPWFTSLQSATHMNHITITTMWTQSGTSRQAAILSKEKANQCYAVIWIYKESCVCVFGFLNYFRIRRKSIKFEMANETKRHKKKDYLIIEKIKIIASLPYHWGDQRLGSLTSFKFLQLG
jgi:hypothetical protein